jgi:type IV pilus assembly protein PilE
MKCSNHSSQGFTLIELMFVVVIIGILAAVAVPAYFNHILRSRQADAYHNLLDIKSAQEMVYSLENIYATSSTALHWTPANTFTKMLSFNFSDAKYFMYYVRSTTNPDVFVGLAKGKLSKLEDNEICIGDDYDPCIVTGTGTLKQSLGLEDCDAPSGRTYPFTNCP